MKPVLARIRHRLAAGFGVRISRAVPPNRFDAMRETLELLRRCGYEPRTVIDAGANEGQWYRIAQNVFPAASFHLIEPQPACWRALEGVGGSASLHRVAVTAPGVAAVRMIGTGTGGSTGAFVATDAEVGNGELIAAATTLDRLLAGRIESSDRALLKLDLEGHELPALSGAEALLPKIEAIVSETRFFRIESDSRQTFADLLRFLEERGFALFDFATLSARRRDGRLRTGDAVFVRADSPLMVDVRWA